MYSDGGGSREAVLLRHIGCNALVLGGHRWRSPHRR